LRNGVLAVSITRNLTTRGEASNAISAAIAAEVA